MFLESKSTEGFVDLAAVKALTFDVFGTVVDYRSSIVAEGRRLSAAHGLDVNWGELADAWRAECRPSMDRAMRDASSWVNVDAIYRAVLDELLKRYGIAGLSEHEKVQFNLVWHHLRPWGDSVPGLERLRARYILATLSNGNVRLLVDMARHARLPWDLVLSSEMARAYKPDPRAYRMALDLLDLRAEEVMMVAAHQYDLRAAQHLGFRTAFVMRPLEHGPHAVPDLTADDSFDVVATDIVDLARQLDL
ncbi:haloacid dehalogenase type II [Kocuria sp. cx-116]|uniref:haloacid dehalogenase type II n=1 Tax=Kocuria sp. cx-116 TaxID=2771378 RepID=UPI001685FDE3|nr:haloacid dehalogenase type II [Kocuria sp. cx-116]MBD2763533.1 haloacid dehalogenase type II [Kocuria sp. cx-116]